MKRKIVEIMALCMVVLLCACGNNDATEAENKEPQETENEIVVEEQEEEQKEEQDESWKKAYCDYMEELNSEYDFDLGFTYFLIYLDDDEIPELFISTESEAGGEIVVTYYNDKVIDYHLSRIGSVYIENSGLILTNTGHMDYYPLTITELKDGVFTEIAEGISYWAEEDREKYANGETEDYILTYEWENQIVTKEEFDKSVNKIFDMEMSKRPENGYMLEEILSILSTGQWTSYNHRYELIEQDVTWDEAQEICKSKGGYLVTITCPDEARVISEQIVNEGKANFYYFVGYRDSEWVGDEFYSNRWINSDGSFITTFLGELSAYYAPDYDMIHQKWRIEDGLMDCGLLKYYEETNRIYVYICPDELLEVSPEYTGKIGFICEYD